MPSSYVHQVGTYSVVLYETRVASSFDLFGGLGATTGQGNENVSRLLKARRVRPWHFASFPLFPRTLCSHRLLVVFDRMSELEKYWVRSTCRASGWTIPTDRVFQSMWMRTLESNLTIQVGRHLQALFERVTITGPFRTAVERCLSILVCPINFRCGTPEEIPNAFDVPFAGSIMQVDHPALRTTKCQV